MARPNRPAKPGGPAKDPATKVAKKVARLSAVAERLATGEAPAAIADELRQVGLLCIRLAENWGASEEEEEEE